MNRIPSKRSWMGAFACSAARGFFLVQRESRVTGTARCGGLLAVQRPMIASVGSVPPITRGHAYADVSRRERLTDESLGIELSHRNRDGAG